MPLVFVHGVATRKNPRYAAQLQRRWPLTRELLFPVWSREPRTVAAFEAFWGDAGATFAWNHACLPVDDGADEQFALDDGTGAGEVLAGFLGPDDDPANPLLAVARRSLPEAVDVLWAYSSEITPDLDEWARFAAWAIAYAEKDPQPDWLAGCDTDETVLARLLQRMPADDPGSESFGGRGLVAVGREAVARMGRAATRAAVARYRPRVHRKVSLFLGDALSYLGQREEHGADGPIATVVAGALAEAMAARGGDDDLLVVIAHSMGGTIVYDLLSNLRTDLRCDVLITVGAQVGLFAELGLLPAVRPPADPLTSRVPPLPGDVRWLNVYDPQDPLAFVAGRIFSNVTDRPFSTGRSVLGAHSSYFAGPRFFEMAAEWLAK
jgi:hypothetical protein